MKYTFDRTLGENRYLDAYKKSGANPDAIDFYGEKMGGQWMNIEGQPLALGVEGGAASEIPLSAYDPETVESRVREVGKFDINGGVIAAIDGRGYPHEAPMTDGRIKALEAAGYTRGEVAVTLGNRVLERGSYATKQWAGIKRDDDLERIRDEQIVHEASINRANGGSNAA